ncbi:MAG TPA: hypothetical protein VGK89_09865 [Candidatus Eisenbacteria bacterium]|jgi:hypothetical protein
MRPGSRALALGLALGLLGAGCASKKTTLDPGFVTPEGKTTPLSFLTTFKNLPNPIFLYREYKPIDPTHPAGPSPGDTLYAVEPAFEGDTTWVRGVVFDSTAADAYQIWKGEGSGGIDQLYDYFVLPSRRWLDTGWEKYSFVDENASAAASDRYSARGVVGGVVTVNAPVTNTAPSPLQTAASLYNIPVNFTGSNDSTLVFTFPAVPSAAGYFIHFYRGRSDSRGSDQFTSGAPAPIWDGRSSDLLLVYVPETGRPCALGPDGESFLTLRGPAGIAGGFLIRISALDCQGRFIAYTLGDPVWIADDISNYRVFYYGSYVFPRPSTNAPLAGPLRALPGSSAAHVLPRSGASPTLAGLAGLKEIPPAGKVITFRYP